MIVAPLFGESKQYAWNGGRLSAPDGPYRGKGQGYEREGDKNRNENEGLTPPTSRHSSVGIIRGIHDSSLIESIHLGASSLIFHHEDFACESYTRIGGRASESA
jgi:hypothetical protein